MFTSLASGLSPVIMQEVALIKEVEQMEEVVDRMNKVLFDRQRNDEEYEHVLVSRNEQYSFITPPSTPGGSMMGSRTGSVRSLNSFSRPSSVASDSINGDGDNFNRSRNNSVSSYQSLHQGNNSNNKRSSTISTKSRDSGFSSQEILLLRQQQETLKQVGRFQSVYFYGIVNIFYCIHLGAKFEYFPQQFSDTTVSGATLLKLLLRGHQKTSDTSQVSASSS